jgi:hypothetical protein
MRLPIYAYFPTLAALAGSLLSSCSSSDSNSTPETRAVPPKTAAVRFPFGVKVDSLNGIAGHTFGQPVSAFTHMRLLPPSPEELSKTYSDEGVAGAKATGWFGKHRPQVPTQLYWFLDDKFSQFRAVGDAATLRAEAIYLLGPGQAQGQYQLFWEGSRARAVFSEQARGFGREGTLDVLSKPLEAELAAKKQARLKAENAQ